MDKREAHLVDASGPEMQMTSLSSEVEDFRPKGGSGTRMKGGPQDVVQDSRYLEREKHQMRSYFERLTTAMQPFDRIVLFGPAQAAEDFKRFLDERARDQATKVSDVKRADSMTPNQVKAWVREDVD